jgi:hypothetical protein
MLQKSAAAERSRRAAAAWLLFDWMPLRQARFPSSLRYSMHNLVNASFLVRNEMAGLIDFRT